MATVEGQLSAELIDKIKASIFVDRKLWVQDNEVNNCWDCQSGFSLIKNRRHHCRVCGRIFCSKCSSKLVLKTRSCDNCFRKFNSAITAATGQDAVAVDTSAWEGDASDPSAAHRSSTYSNFTVGSSSTNSGAPVVISDDAFDLSALASQVHRDSTFKSGECSWVHVALLEGFHLNQGLPCNAYAVIHLRAVKGSPAKIDPQRQQTSTKMNTSAPLWQQDCSFVISDTQIDQVEVVVTIYKHRTGKLTSGNVFVGEAVVPLKQFVKEKHKFEWMGLYTTPSVRDVEDQGSGKKESKKHDDEDEDEILVEEEFRNKSGQILLKLCLVRHEGDTFADRTSPLVEGMRVAALSELPLTIPQVKRKPLRLFVGTWNMAKVSPSSMETWLPENAGQDYDLVVIGLQESEYKPRPDKSGHPSPYPTAEADLAAAFNTHLGRHFSRVCVNSMREIRLFVYCHEDLYPYVSDVTSTVKATGIGNVIGNKGGVSCCLSVYHTRMTFLSSHLAAHQDRLPQRNEDYHMIMRHGSNLGSTKEFLHDADFLFFFGDLNYRLAFGNQGLSRKPSLQQFNQMTELIKEKQTSYLFGFDQLRTCIARKESFVGFNEGDPSVFPPTFKVLQNIKGCSYRPNRSPAYCDRVLYRALRPQDCTLTGYGASIQVTSSDHKPVWSTFNVNVSSLAAPEGIAGENMFLTIVNSLNVLVTNDKGKPISSVDVTSIEFSLNCLSKPFAVALPLKRKIFVKLMYSSLARIKQETIYCRLFRNKEHIGSTAIPLERQEEESKDKDDATAVDNDKDDDGGNDGDEDDVTTANYDVPVHSIVTLDAVYVGELRGTLRLMFKKFNQLHTDTNDVSKHKKSSVSQSTRLPEKTKRAPPPLPNSYTHTNKRLSDDQALASLGPGPSSSSTAVHDIAEEGSDSEQLVVQEAESDDMFWQLADKDHAQRSRSNASGHHRSSMHFISSLVEAKTKLRSNTRLHKPAFIPNTLQEEVVDVDGAEVAFGDAMTYNEEDSPFAFGLQGPPSDDDEESFNLKNDSD